MDFVFRCQKDLEVLNAKYKEYLSVPYVCRDHRKISIIQDMIADVEFAMSEYLLGHIPQEKRVPELYRYRF